MPLHFLPLALTVLAVVVLGIVAIVSSTSGGASWLQKLWKDDAAAPGSRSGREQQSGDGSGANGLDGAADPLGNPVEGGHGRDRAQVGGLTGHAVDDA
jgi:hypothetical protein